MAVVFDVNHKLKVAVQDASDLEDAKKKAEGYAAGYLRYLGAGDLPDVHWDANPRNRTAQLRRWKGLPNGSPPQSTGE